jgi:hypothetical protein
MTSDARLAEQILATLWIGLCRKRCAMMEQQDKRRHEGGDHLDLALRFGAARFARLFSGSGGLPVAIAPRSADQQQK